MKRRVDLRKRCARMLGIGLAGLLASGVAAGPAPAQNADSAPARVDIVYLSLAVNRVLPQSFLDQPASDDGLAGAKLAVADNEVTGQFTRQTFHLDDAALPDSDGVIAAFKKFAASGSKLFVVDLPAPLLLQVADLPEAKGVTIIDATARDDALRAESCRRNVLHTMPSRAMLADALAQYLTLKKWPNIVLVVGMDDADKAYADAIRNAARKFRLRIVKEIPWSFEPGARRTDTGHFSVQSEVASATQGMPGYDVLVVADEADNFGDELGYRTTDPRPVMGTEGLVPMAWARAYEEQGAIQLQGRFRKLAGRWMTERDYGAWLAVKAIGEAATTAATADQAAIAAAMRSKDFGLAAYKGPKLSFRDWDGQLRQPVLLADDRALVSVAPEPGFLHQFTELDTLGVDRPETKCHLQ